MKIQTFLCCLALLFFVFAQEQTTNTDPQNVILCDTCELVVGWVENYLAENKTQEEIIKGVDHLCDLLPSSVKTYCKQMVLNYIPLIIKYLESEEPPEKCCESLGLCQPKKIQELPEKKEKICEVCEWLTTKIEKFLAQGKTETEIEKLMELACKILPSDYSTMCTNVINDYLPMIIKYLEMEYPPETCCSKVDLCKN
ncbi:hypothetical protein M0813_03782 [Anaeramoeba flamelloides]|uniref:Saposin B-type domain-containing protein n=1 Tax=Anaeramoeba flamelloides TaxID=1746091 RepID=A0ABQ8XSM9_9EUKA|nr:hypothetical protein M0813_03782 [Anaeramoeba flamelloides]